MNKIFEKLVKQIRELLLDFGKHLAVDSKAIPSFAKRKNEKKTTDGRRDADANYGKKEYRGQNKDGSLWEKIVKWFGYKLHLVVDAIYELPVAYKVTKASASDTRGGNALLEQIKEKQPEILWIAETWTGDKGYDDTKLIEKCWDQYQIKPATY